FFFFSSRRRHTRSTRDWSSDVCSSDLAHVRRVQVRLSFTKHTLDNGLDVLLHQDRGCPIVAVNLWYHVGSKNEQPGHTGFAHLRSEERRVGKEGRARVGAGQGTKESKE